jgi:aspartate-semialdehyde dehydrogenase
MSSKDYVMVLVGATGVVGKEMLHLLSKRSFPIRELRPVASSRTAGSVITFGNRQLKVTELKPDVFKGADLAFFTASTAVSREHIPAALAAGCVVADDSSAYRSDPEIPLVVPEINGHLLSKFPSKKVFPVANCATIQLVVALAPIHKAARIRRIVVSTYQSTSGAGRRAMEELSKQVTDLFNMRQCEPKVFPYQIAFNVIPQIDQFLPDGSTGEEQKIAFETQKIFGDPLLGVSVTSVRVPTFHGHAESVNVETEKPLTPEDAKKLLSKADGVKLLDDDQRKYPILMDVVGQDEVYVGRVRKDPSRPNCLNLWVVGDNLRKGAALNAVQIFEKLKDNDLI